MNKVFLEEKTRYYNQPSFIASDPIAIPRHFSKKEDIEISGFITATISWGQRATILKSAGKLMQWMDYAPHDFILNFNENDLALFRSFVHRTFNGEDCTSFLLSLQHVYRMYGGLERIFEKGYKASGHSIQAAIASARESFFEIPHPSRTEKHFSNPVQGSAAKRINMFLRWMVRRDHHGVDFGIWKSISPADLYCPLDVHSGRVARKLGLLSRKQNDWKAAEELTSNLKKLDPTDPVKYDFALFGLGIFEGF